MSSGRRRCDWSNHLAQHRRGLGRPFILDEKGPTFVDTQSDAIASFDVLELEGEKDQRTG